MKRGALFVSCLTVLSLAAANIVSADDRAFLSTGLESSQAWYVLEFSPLTGGSVDKFRLTFPAGTLTASTDLGELVINGKPAKGTTTTSVDLGNHTLLIDLSRAVLIRQGTEVMLEVVGLTNPPAGAYQIGVELLGTLNNVVEVLAPIPLSITPLAAGSGSGDITGVIAGTGLSGGGLIGDVTLSVDTTQIQKRVAGSCSAGNAIRVVNQDGTVTCQAAGGSVTSVGTGSGLTGGPITSTGTISVATGGVTTALLADGAVTGAKLGANSVDSSKIVDGSIGVADVNAAQIQARVTGACTTGNAIRAIDSAGAVTCEATGGGGGGGWTDDGTAVRLTTSTDNVGIGTATPASKFHVVSSSASALPPRLQSAGTNTFGAGLDLYHGATGKGYVGVPDPTAGIGPGELLVFGSTGVKTSLWAGAARVVTVAPNGNVGIGTASPDNNTRLQILGQDGLRISGYQPFLTLQDDNASSKRGFVQSVNGGVNLLTNNGAGLVVQDVTGNVGIGTASPSSPLTVQGTADPLLRLNHTGASGNPALYLQQDGLIKAYAYWNPNNASLAFGTASTNPVMSLFDGGAMRTAGNTEVGGDLTIDGSALVVGRFYLGPSPGFNFGNPVGACIDLADNRRPLGFCTSSLRYKTDARTFTGGLDIVNQLRPISFTWKGEGGANDIGLAAEEVDQVEPLLTFRNEKGEIEGVRYNQLSAVFVNAFKDQQVQIEEQRGLNKQQQQQIQSQQTEISQLKARLEELEQLVKGSSRVASTPLIQ